MINNHWVVASGLVTPFAVLATDSARADAVGTFESWAKHGEVALCIGAIIYLVARVMTNQQKSLDELTAAHLTSNKEIVSKLDRIIGHLDGASDPPAPHRLNKRRT